MASQTKEDEQAALEASIASLIVNSESDISEATMLLQRCRVLLDDIEQFERHMASKNFKIELRHFKSGVQTECKQLEKLSTADPDAPKSLHTLRSSNFPFFEALWDEAKRSSYVTALQKRFYFPPITRSGNRQTRNNKASKGEKSVLVDIVSDNGATWTKVSTITERRIVHELAKAGYFYDTEEEESEDEDDDAPEGLLKLAKSLDRARKVGRVHYRYPVVRLLLPRIEKGCNAQVEALLARIQKLGIEVIRAEDIREAKPISEVLDQMAGDPYAGFSDVLNVDCTILLALVSDLSHGSVAVEDWQHRAVKAQIEREKDDQLLPKVLWPACGSRKLVCSKEAADRCREIVATIGTVRETRRTQLIFGGDELTPEERKRELRELSTYSIPDELQLPIEEIDVSIPDCVLKIGYLAVRVAEKLTVINQSVFLYGWLEGLTTISSNRTVVKDIENLVEQHRQHDEDRGPDVWICPTARSLVGKEKTRRNWQNMS